MKLVPPESRSLEHFQESFARALVGPAPAHDCATDVARLISQPGFAVYRNTVFKGCIDALQANYPTVTRLVGEEWIRAAAARFAHSYLPAHPMLLEYGAQFPSFLAGFEPAAGLPYLADIARLDRFWTEAHGAPDEAPIRPDAIGALAREDLAHARLLPHASARWAWFEAQPIFTIWSRNRSDDDSAGGDIAWFGEGALIVRPYDSVQAVALTRADVAFLDACAAGDQVADAAQAALEAGAGVDLAQLIARLLNAGAFGRIESARLFLGGNL